MYVDAYLKSQQCDTLMSGSLKLKRHEALCGSLLLRTPTSMLSELKTFVEEARNQDMTRTAQQDWTGLIV